MKESDFSNLLLDIAFLHAGGRLVFSEPSDLQGWEKKTIGSTDMWILIKA